MHTIRIRTGEITFGKTEVVDGIKQIGLASAIVTADSHNSFRKTEGLFCVVFKLNKRYGLKSKHGVEDKDRREKEQGTRHLFKKGEKGFGKQSIFCKFG